VFFGEADFHHASFGSAALFKKAQFKEPPDFGDATCGNGGKVTPKSGLTFPLIPTVTTN